MWWKVFQLTIVVSVLFSNIHYEWATGPLVAPFCALAAAWLGTAIIIAIKDLATRLKALLLRSHKRIY